MADMTAIRNVLAYTALRGELRKEEQEAKELNIYLDLASHFDRLVANVNSYLKNIPAPPVEYCIPKSYKGALISPTVIDKFIRYMESLNYFSATSKYKDHYVFKYQRLPVKPEPTTATPERVYTYIIGERVIETHLSPTELKLIRDATSYWFSEYTDEDLIGYLKEFDYCITETAITKELP